MGNVPLFHQTLLMQQLASEQLLVEAHAGRQLRKSVTGFHLNRTVPTMAHAKAILDEMITTNQDYWPHLQRAWQNGEATR